MPVNITPTTKKEIVQRKRKGGGIDPRIATGLGTVGGAIAGGILAGPGGALAGASQGAALGAGLGSAIGATGSAARPEITQNVQQAQVRLGASGEAARSQKLLAGLKAAQSNPNFGSFTAPISSAYIQSLINLKQMG